MARNQNLSATQTEDTRGPSTPQKGSPVESAADASECAASPKPGTPEPTCLTESAPVPSSSGRWWAGVAVGGVVMCPLTWLLSHAATLPFFIGVFFFALFGLVIGASVHRVAAAGGLYSRKTVLLGTTLLVLTGWGASIFLESGRFPEEVAKFAQEQAHDIGNQTPQGFREGVAGRTRQHIRDHFPPGGVLGYAKWSLQSGRILPKEVNGLLRPFRSGQAKFWWGFRLTLSVALLAFGISSQTLPLAVSRKAGAAANPTPE